LRQHAIFQPQPGWRRFGMQLLGALALMGVVLWLASGASESWLSGGALIRALRLTGVVLLGAGSYFVALWLFGLRPRDFIKRVG